MSGKLHETFKLKANNKFKERSVSFGVSEALRKNYEIKNDTIFFSEIVPRGEEYYKFGVLKKSKHGGEKHY